MTPTSPPPSLIPLGHGGVQLVWDNRLAELEIEVIAPHEMIVFILDKASGEEREWPLPTADFSEIAELIGEKVQA
jgi:hypothetical protein